jgi:hypothetical protein
MALIKKKPTCTSACIFMKWLVAVVLTIVLIASAVGVFESHVLIAQDASRVLFQFGSTSGSLSILAFVVTLAGWVKCLKAMKSPCEVCAH